MGSQGFELMSSLSSLYPYLSLFATFGDVLWGLILRIERIITQKQKHSSRTKNAQLFLFDPTEESEDRMSFGQFMDSFEQQKDEIVKEWIQKNDIETLENTCRVQKEMDRKDFEKTYGL